VLKRIHNGGPASIQVVPTGSQPKMMRLRREMAQNDRTKTGFRVGYSEFFFFFQKCGYTATKFATKFVASRT
jgi:hypothetical protein